MTIPVFTSLSHTASSRPGWVTVRLHEILSQRKRRGGEKEVKEGEKEEEDERKKKNRSREVT